MKTYSQFAPTPFDSRGLNLPNRQDWLVCPCSQTRDSDCLERSNFISALESLGGESETVEVHRFGHWGPGWFEIIIVDPSRSADVQSIEDRLERYPSLDDETLSRLEDEECETVWSKCFNTQDRLDYFRRHSYCASSISQLLAAIRGDWHSAANALNCPSDLLY